jgi:hypothetical protein
MNLLQMRQVLEQVLGYADFDYVNNVWTRTTRQDAPGWYYQQDTDGDLVKVCPCFYVIGKQRVPSNWQPVGLEVTLEDTPRVSAFDRIGMIEKWSFYTVWLQQHDSTKNIFNHEDLIMRHFGSEANSTKWRKDDVDLNDRRMFTIKTIDYELHNYPTTAKREEVPSVVQNSPFTTFYDQ